MKMREFKVFGDGCTCKTVKGKNVGSVARTHFGRRAWAVNGYTARQ